MVSYDRTSGINIGDVTFSMRHIQCPKDVLSSDEFDTVLEDVVSVAADAFGRITDDAFRNDVCNHIARTEHLLLLYHHEELVAFRIWDFVALNITQDVLYLGGMCVRQAWQGQGIGQALLDHVLHVDAYRQIHSVDQICALPQCTFVIMRTQNPIMKHCLDNVMGGVSYPEIVDGSIPQDVRHAARCVANHLGDENLDEYTLISTGVYGDTLYGEDYNHTRLKPLTADSPFVRIDAAAGDALYCVWRR